MASRAISGLKLGGPALFTTSSRIVHDDLTDACQCPYWHELARRVQALFMHLTHWMDIFGLPLEKTSCWMPQRQSLYSSCYNHYWRAAEKGGKDCLLSHSWGFSFTSLANLISASSVQQYSGISLLDILTHVVFSGYSPNKMAYSFYIDVLFRHNIWHPIQVLVRDR